MVRKMGPIGNLLGMLPGVGQMKDALPQVDDKDMDRTAAIIQSMTPAERRDPKIINGSRRQRIAKGSGSTVAQVNALVDRFFEARKMMSAMAGRFGFPGARPLARSQGGQGHEGRVRHAADAAEGHGLPGGMPGMPGMGGMPGGFPPAVRPAGRLRAGPVPPATSTRAKIKLPKQ